MDNYGKNKKKFIFYMTDDDHARFLTKTTADGIKKLVLIRDFIEAYINNDPNILAWLEGELSCKKSAKWMRTLKRQSKKEALMNYNLNLDNKDVSEIFDILAEEEKDE